MTKAAGTAGVTDWTGSGGAPFHVSAAAHTRDPIMNRAVPRAIRQCNRGPATTSVSAGSSGKRGGGVPIGSMGHAFTTTSLCSGGGGTGLRSGGGEIGLLSGGVNGSDLSWRAGRPFTDLKEGSSFQSGSATWKASAKSVSSMRPSTIGVGYMRMFRPKYEPGHSFATHESTASTGAGLAPP